MPTGAEIVTVCRTVSDLPSKAPRLSDALAVAKTKSLPLSPEMAFLSRRSSRCRGRRKTDRRNILEGEKRAGLPVQAPTNYDLEIKPQDGEGAPPRTVAVASRVWAKAPCSAATIFFFAGATFTMWQVGPEKTGERCYNPNSNAGRNMPSPLPCPFCGHLPGWRKQQIQGSGYLRQLRCINPDCKLEVHTRRSAIDQELIADWNERIELEQLPAGSRVRKHLRTMLKRAKIAKGES